jgi:DNA modification methylase
MLTDTELKKKIRAVNWNFHDALTNHGLHKFHWYPGSFIPQIPAYLIELLSNRDEIILDPFCGSGTTLIEAIRLGRKAIGIDYNLIATLIANAKTKFIEPDGLEEIAVHFINKLDDARFNLHFIGFDVKTLKGTNVNIQELRKWLHEKTLQEAFLIWTLIEQEEDYFKGLLLMIFSGLQLKFARPHKHWGYIADNVAPSKRVYVNAIDLFIVFLKDYIAEINKFLKYPAIKKYSIKELNQRTKVINADISSKLLLKKEYVDLIITSPPYVNVTDYATSQRLSLYWFGEDIHKLKNIEIGARWKRARKDAVSNYLSEMDSALSFIIEYLKPGKFFCVIIGESESKKKQYNIIKNLKNVFLSKGLKIVIDDIYRKPIRQRVRAQKAGNVDKEYIIIFRKI